MSVSAPATPLRLTRQRRSKPQFRERVQGAFTSPFALAGVEYATTASIGVALFPTDAADAKSHVTAADVGIYVNKRAGRGRTSSAAGNREAA